MRAPTLAIQCAMRPATRLQAAAMVFDAALGFHWIAIDLVDRRRTAALNIEARPRNASV